MSRHKHNHSVPPGEPSERVTSLFAHWSNDFTAQVFLACVGLMLLGIALWTVFISPPSPHDPESWSGWRFWDVAVVFMAWVSLSALLRLSWEVALHEVRARGGAVIQRLTKNLGLVVAQVIAMYVAFGVFGLWQHRLGLSAIGLKPIPTPWLIVSLLVGFVVGPLQGLVAVIVTRRAGVKIENPQTEFMAPLEPVAPGAIPPRPPRVLISPVGAIGMVLMAGLAVPFGEEALFRGILYSWLRDVYGPWFAVFASSLLFGLCHFRWDRTVVVVTFVTGIFLAILYESSGSLWAPIIVHVMNNFPKVALVYADRLGWFDWLTPVPRRA
jgi:membrane protease YdiL (CAAX protease family)